MEIGTIENVAQPSSVNRFNELTSEDFIRIMFTELASQDPLDPQDSQDLLNQVRTIRDIESDMRLMEKLDDLVEQNRFASAGNMVGKAIRGLDENLVEVEGVVKSVSLERDEIILTLDDGQRVPFDHVKLIYDPSSQQ